MTVLRYVQLEVYAVHRIVDLVLKVDSALMQPKAKQSMPQDLEERSMLPVQQALQMK